MTTALSNLNKDCDGVTTKKEIDKKDIIEKELLAIEELDASIHDLQLKIQEISNELNDLQIKNREKLKQMLLSSPPECGSLAKNTQLFLNLHSNESSDDRKKICDHDVLRPSAVTNESTDHSKSDEANQELESLMNYSTTLSEPTKNCSDEESENCEDELNLYSIDGESHTAFIME